MTTGTPEDVVRRAQKRLEMIGGQLAELTFAMMAKAAPDFDLKAFAREHRGENPLAASASVAGRFTNVQLPDEDVAKYAALETSLQHVMYILTGVEERSEDREARSEE